MLMNRLCKIFGIGSWVLLVTIWILVVYALMTFTNKIPIHFNYKGEVDNYGSKYAILLLPILASFIVVLFSIINKYPQLQIKQTAKVQTPKQLLYNKLLLAYIKFTSLVLFNFIVIQTILIVQEKATSLTLWFIPTTFILMFLPTIYLVYKSNKEN